MISNKPRTIDYEGIVQKALREVVRSVLYDTAKNGRPGSHHFYISFLTQLPGVDIPDYLKHEYPDEITIVLQHEFWDLEVDEDEDTFSVTLCFNDIHERLTIPFAAIVSFVDPSVKFGLQFTPTIHEFDLEEDAPKKSKKTTTKSKSKAKKTKNTADDGNNVVQLDAFRKK